MSNPSQIDQIAERIERLLLRHAELQRTNTLLTDQITTLTNERDSLKHAWPRRVPGSMRCSTGCPRPTYATTAKKPHHEAT